MKIHPLSVMLVTALAFALSLVPSRAQTTYTTATNGAYAGDVINSTFTFSGLGPNVTGFNAVLEQTQISQNALNNIAPPAQFELEITSLTYVDTQNLFHGTGSPLQINIDFTEQPNINQGGQPTATVTLLSQNSYSGTVQASSQNPVTFTLASPVIFPLSTAQNLGNLASAQPGQPLSTWNDSVSNIHAMGQASSTEGGSTFQYNLNGTFSNLGGSLEVVYATPEPNSSWLALVAGLGFAGLIAARRKRA
jgi:hypothetical protein